MNSLKTILSLVFMGGMACAGADTTATPIQVLIVDGFSNHDWGHTTRLIRSVLVNAGHFEVSVSTTPQGKEMAGGNWRPRFGDFDVVIQNCNDIGGGPSWPEEVQRDFENYVHGGGGVFMFHSANNAFAGWPAYNEMIGLGWRQADYGVALEIPPDGGVKRIPPGMGKGTGHGSRTNALIHRLGDHPIHAGLPRRWRASDIEVYFYARGPAKNLDVLSYAHDIQSGKNWPVEWVVAYGDGRVYNSTFGHVWRDDPQPLGMRCAGFQTLVVRACQWLARREVDAMLPEDFPGESSVSLRAEFGEQAAPD